jgi:hypothetical protein
MAGNFVKGAVGRGLREAGIALREGGAEVRFRMFFCVVGISRYYRLGVLFAMA